MDNDNGPENSRRLQVDWARRGWCHCISKILGTLDDANAMERLKLSEAQDGDESKTQQFEDADLFFKLVVRCAAHRAWVSASWSEIPPNNWSGILHQDPAEAQAALDAMFEDATCVEKGLGCMSANDHPDREARFCWISSCSYFCHSEATTEFWEHPETLRAFSTPWAIFGCIRWLWSRFGHCLSETLSFYLYIIFSGGHLYPCVLPIKHVDNEN